MWKPNLIPFIIILSAVSALQTPNKVTLISSDGVEFQVDKIVALQSPALEEKISGSDSHVAFPLANISSDVLAKFIEYSERQVELLHHGKNSSCNLMDEWNKNFVKMDNCTLLRLVSAASMEFRMYKLAFLGMHAISDITMNEERNLINDDRRELKEQKSYTWNPCNCN